MQARSANDVVGIDVSRHQGVIDWAKVAAGGIEYAFIKATEGVGYVDPMFEKNATGAAAAGLHIGFYHYARPENNTPETEAAAFAAAVQKWPSQLPLVLDVEGEANKLGKTALTQWCAKFLQALQQKTGRPVMIYTGAYFAKDYLGKELAQYPLWVAHYGADRPKENTTWDKWAVFQYTSSGKVPGIVGNVDMNVMEADFMSYQISKADCDKITSLLGILWTMENTGQLDVKAKGGVDVDKAEIGRLADEVRKAAGQPTQNK